MDTLTTVLSFTYPHEAHLAKGKLESEGIEVFLKDELTTQVNNFYSHAIGGVKLQVRSDQIDTAHRLLVQSGYIEEQTHQPNKLLIKLEKLTSTLPLIGRLSVQLRLLIAVALVATVIVVAIMIVAWV